MKIKDRAAWILAVVFAAALVFVAILYATTQPTMEVRDWNCGDFDTWLEAYDKYREQPGDPYRLDGDGDGIPCEALRK